MQKLADISAFENIASRSVAVENKISYKDKWYGDPSKTYRPPRTLGTGSDFTDTDSTQYADVKGYALNIGEVKAGIKKVCDDYAHELEQFVSPLSVRFTLGAMDEAWKYISFLRSKEARKALNISSGDLKWLQKDILKDLDDAATRITKLAVEPFTQAKSQINAVFTAKKPGGWYRFSKALDTYFEKRQLRNLGRDGLLTDETDKALIPGSVELDAYIDRALTRYKQARERRAQAAEFVRAGGYRITEEEIREANKRRKDYFGAAFSKPKNDGKKDKGGSPGYVPDPDHPKNLDDFKAMVDRDFGNDKDSMTKAYEGYLPKLAKGKLPKDEWMTVQALGAKLGRKDHEKKRQP